MQLTPLEKTVAGQELIQIGVARGTQKGLQEGITKGRLEGRLIGQIHATQRFLKRPVTSQKRLIDKNLKELRVLLKQLEAEWV